MPEYRKAEGRSVVEMECSSLAACAQFRNIIFGQFLFTADSLDNTEATNSMYYLNKVKPLPKDTSEIL